MDVNGAQVINFEKICRLCLRERQILTEIFESAVDGNYLTIDQKIMACASIGLCRDDCLPKRICSKCLSRVNAAFDLRIQCENSDKILHDINDLLFANKTTNEKVGVSFNKVDIEEGEKSQAEKQAVNDFGHVIFIKKQEIEISTGDTNGELFYEIDIGKTEEKIQSKKVDTRHGQACLSSRHPSDSRPSSRKKEPKFSFEVSNGNGLAGPSKPEEPRRKLVAVSTWPGEGEGIKEANGESKLEGGEARKTACPFCKKMLTRMDEHVRLLHRNRVYKCTKNGCGAEFLTLKNLQSHRLNCYGVEKAYKCLRCLKEFHRKSNLKAHVRRHANKKDFQCQSCERAFVDSTGLRRHFLKHHEPEKEIFVSGCCGKKFKSKEGLKKHVRRSICGIRIFKLAE